MILLATNSPEKQQYFMKTMFLILLPGPFCFENGNCLSIIIAVLDFPSFKTNGGYGLR